MTEEAGASPLSDKQRVIAEAFSLTAEKYDRFAEDHPNLTRMRSQVYAHLVSQISPGDRILELNAGSGTDAAYLGRLGFRVHATDIAPGMLSRAREKIARWKLTDRVTVQETSFTELTRVDGAPYDVVFSNLGGLNCVPDLRPIADQLRFVLRPGGLVTWVLMPRICLWELSMAVSGKTDIAFRRLSRAGTIAHLEGRYFRVYYFTPREVLVAFGKDYRLERIEGLSIFAPPAESRGLAGRHPRAYSALCWLDQRLARRPPFYGWGDFFILSVRYVG